MGERGGHWQSVLGQQGGGAGACRQIPGRAVQPERRGETALPDGPAIKGRNTPARLPPRFPAPGKCTSHLGFGLGRVPRCAFESSPGHLPGIRKRGCAKFTTGRAATILLIRTGAAGRSANPTLWGRCQIVTGGHIDDPTTRSDIHSPITLAVALVWATRRNNA